MKIIQEFREFISRGNVIDLAIGIIIGSAFSAIVNSLVNDVFLPLVGILLGNINFVSLSFKLGESEIRYGNFLQETVNFLVIAGVVFALVKIINSLHRKKKKEDKKEDLKEKKQEDENTRLLREIRDALKKQK